MLAPWKKSYDKPRQHIEKQTYHYANEGLSSLVFPVVRYRCESSFIKKAEWWRIDAFNLWCWRKLLRIPWTARRSNQSVLKEISPGCSLEELLLEALNFVLCILATWCKELTRWKRPWCWERLKAEGEEGDRGWGNWMASPIQWTWSWANFGRWWRTGRAGVLQSIGSQGVRHNNCRLSICRFLVVWVTGYETEKLA